MYPYGVPISRSSRNPPGTCPSEVVDVTERPARGELVGLSERRDGHSVLHHGPWLHIVILCGPSEGLVSRQSAQSTY